MGSASRRTACPYGTAARRRRTRSCSSGAASSRATDAEADDEPSAWRETGRDGKLERSWPDGRREVQYRNGTRKLTDPATGDAVVTFTNGDVKTTTAAGSVVYFYAAAETTHTCDPRTGLETFEFPNGQVEKHNKDGSKDITFPDGTKKFVHANGASRTRFPDGVVVES